MDFPYLKVALKVARFSKRLHGVLLTMFFLCFICHIDFPFQFSVGRGNFPKDGIEHC